MKTRTKKWLSLVLALCLILSYIPVFPISAASNSETITRADMEAALEWLAGREYTMSEITLLDIYDIAKEKKVTEYEDKEVRPSRLPDSVTVMNMFDPFNWLRESNGGTWGWISDYCNDEHEYGRLDSLYRIIEGALSPEDEFCNPPTEEEIKADYQNNFPLLLAGVFENLAESIRKGELTFTMDYGKR